LCQKAIENDFSEYEREAKAAATILNCIVVCCKGGGFSIDPVIAPIMELVISRLPQCKSFGLRSRLLCTAMGVVVYNPESACEFYRSVPEVEVLIFETLFTSLPKIFRSSQQQVCIAAFSSLLAIPPTALPAFLQANVQALMTFSIRLISLLEENDEEEGDYEDEDYEDEEGEEGGDEDDDNEENIARTRSALKKFAKHAIPDEGFDEDEDCLNAEDETYLEAVEELNMLDRVKKEMKGDEDFEDDEDDEDVDDFTSPLDNTDMLSQFCDTMNRVHAQNPEYIAQLQANLEPDDQTRLQEIIGVAAMRKEQPQPDA
jgi:hypothetical protein